MRKIITKTEFIRIFDSACDPIWLLQMRWTEKVSMWPVGLVTHLGVSSPVVVNGKVISFYDGWFGARKFPVDMAGFAVNIKFLLTVWYTCINESQSIDGTRCAPKLMTRMNIRGIAIL